VESVLLALLAQREALGPQVLREPRVRLVRAQRVLRELQDLPVQDLRVQPVLPDLRVQLGPLDLLLQEPQGQQELQD
jgi:hypothetical protein